MCEVADTLTTSMKDALSWLAKRGGDGCFDLNGVALAAGQSAPFMRSTWNNLEQARLIEFYKPTGKGRGRLRLTEFGRQTVAIMPPSGPRAYRLRPLRSR